jgi:hypothetical protein
MASDAGFGVRRFDDGIDLPLQVFDGRRVCVLSGSTVLPVVAATGREPGCEQRDCRQPAQ